MVSVTFSVPDDIKSEMKELSWINWSELGRLETLKRLKEEEMFEEFKKIAAKSKLSEQDAVKLGIEVNKSLRKRYKELA